MPKRAVPTSRIAVLLDARSPVPLYKQLYMGVGTLDRSPCDTRSWQGSDWSSLVAAFWA